DPSESKTDALLAQTTIFASLTSQERATIAAKLRPQTWAAGDTLLQPGTVLESLFIVASGVLSCRRDDGDSEEELVRFGPGDHFGEIGMLTGAASRVSITALTAALVYELPKDELAPILEASPRLSQALSLTAAGRQTEIGPAVAV